ncbi:hypothetical protein BJX99DRAFT_272544 [Aspergillus californicus]
MASQAQESYALKIGERVLVTGANGFIGSNVVDVLLSLGYIDRGTVRSEKPWLNELFESKYAAAKFETVIIPTLDDKDALAAVLDGVSGIIHVASDTSFGADPNIINYVVSAAEARVVLTSSSVAAVARYPGEFSIVLPQGVYVASKAEGKRAAYAWVKKNKPSFTFNSVLPNYTLLEGNDMVINAFVSQYYIDVKDFARLHVIALLDPSVKSERIFGLAAPLIWKEVIDTLCELRPAASDKLVKNPPAPVRAISKLCCQLGPGTC